MSWFGKQEKTYAKGMWINEQEWRDQIICQMIYLRAAIYFVGFVVAVSQSASWLKHVGLDDQHIFFVYLVIAISTTVMYWRAASKANFFEKRSVNTTYDEN